MSLFGFKVITNPWLPPNRMLVVSGDDGLLVDENFNVVAELKGLFKPIVITLKLKEGES